jgi:hypothetical protein
MFDKFKKLLADDSRAQSGGMASLFIGLLVAAIVAFEVFIPVITDAASNLTGTTATIADLLPLFAALLVLIGLASPLMRRT